MDEFFQSFLDEFGPEIRATVPSEDQIKKYNGILPDALLEYWRTYGWAGFHDGLLWISSPDPLSPAAETWLSHLGTGKENRYLTIARTAFGKLFLWDQKNGQTVTIAPHYSQIFTSPANPDVISGNSDLTIKFFFLSRVASSLDFDDYKDKPLFKRAVKKLGVLESDEMYSFEPALALGGLPKLENLVKVKMVEQLVLLEQLGDVDVLHMDVSRHI